MVRINLLVGLRYPARRPWENDQSDVAFVIDPPIATFAQCHRVCPVIRGQGQSRMALMCPTKAEARRSAIPGNAGRAGMQRGSLAAIAIS
jgi:hypothetical protein